MLKRAVLQKKFNWGGEIVLHGKYYKNAALIYWSMHNGGGIFCEMTTGQDRSAKWMLNLDTKNWIYKGIQQSLIDYWNLTTQNCSNEVVWKRDRYN